MNKKIFAGVAALTLAISGGLCGCGADSSSQKSKTKKIVENDASDFKWREFTAEEAPEVQGGILITGYVGERTDVVIPKSIQDKPVVAIDDYAFCPYTEEDLTYNHSGDNDLDPEEKLFELAGADDYDTWYEKNSDESLGSMADIQYAFYTYRDELLHKYLEGHESVSDIQSIMIPNTIEVVGKLAFGFCDSLETVEVYGTDESKTPSVQCYYTPFFNNSKLKSFNFYLASERGYGNNDFFEYCTSLEDVYLYPTDEDYVSLNWLEAPENINSIHIADGTTSLSGVSSNPDSYDTTDPVLTYGKYSNIIFEKSVSEIYLPSSLSDISNHTFCTHISTELSKLKRSEIEEMECPDHASVIVIAPEGSYAESYANDHGISCVNSEDEITKKMREAQQTNHQKQYEEALARMEIKKEYLALYEEEKNTQTASQSAKEAANSALTELDESGYDVSGTYIISSDETKNFQCSDSILTDFNRVMSNYFRNLEAYDYFVVVKNGNCNYAVVRNRNHTDIVKTYPETKLYRGNSEFEDFLQEDYSYEDLYAICVDETEYNWRNAYLEQINTIPTKADMEYSLVYIDNDDIPELIIGDPVDSGAGGVYTYNNADSVKLTDLMLRCIMDGYIEKNGTFGTYWWWIGDEGYVIYEIQNGTVNTVHSFYANRSTGEDVYSIDNETVTAEEYQQTYEQYSSQFTEVTYCSYDEIMEKLNTNS